MPVPNDDQLWYRWWSLQLGSLIKFESVLKSDCGSFQYCNLSEHVDHIGFKKYCAITYQSQLIILLNSVQWPYHAILITLITPSKWGPAYIWSYICHLYCLTSMKATYQRKLVILFDMLSHSGINPFFPFPFHVFIKLITTYWSQCGPAYIWFCLFPCSPCNVILPAWRLMFEVLVNGHYIYHTIKQWPCNLHSPSSPQT